MGVSALLDTHTLLWALFEPEKLSPHVRDVLEDSHSTLYVSAISFFEIAQKIRVGKLQIDESLLRQLPQSCAAMGWGQMDLDASQAIDAGCFDSVHRDPFDRLLSAQAASENLMLLSADEAVDAFPIQRVW